MAIYITGDIHAKPERFSSKNFQKHGFEPLGKNDIVFICGDFGIPWGEPMSAEESYWLNWLEEKRAVFAFVDGNHENFNQLHRFKVKEWNGGLVHELRPNVLHLMRGEVFNVNDLRIFAFGGAMSTDKEFRRENVSWWKQEIYSPMELINAKQNLQKVNFSVDIIITHTAPKKFLQAQAKELYMMELWFERMNHDPVCKMLSTLEEKLRYKMWYFGHFHFNWVNEEQKCRGIYMAIDKIA